MTVNIESVQVNLASEHLLLIGLVLLAAAPKLKRLLKLKK